MLEKNSFDQPKTSKVPKSNLPDSSIVDISSALFILRIQYTQIQCVEGARDVQGLQWLHLVVILGQSFMKNKSDISVFPLPTPTSTPTPVVMLVTQSW